jgi:hypothetical protein
MSENYVIHIKGEAVENSLKSAEPWIVANIEQSIGWPEENIIIKYEGSDLHLLTYTEQDYMSAVAIKIANGINSDEAKAKITRFLSALNWVSGGLIRIDYWTGGGRPTRSKNTKGMKYTAKSFRITYIPSNLTSDQQLALALLREADSLSSSNYGYSFLSYYKIINLVKKNGEKQKKWIRNNLNDLKDNALARVDELKNDGEKIDEYLYTSCRCALAHAGVDPTVNPDDVNDSVRLYKDLPLIRHLAKKMIESHFAIKTDSAVYHDHLYELSGFKRLLGNDLIAEILTNDAVNRGKVKIDKKISIRQWCDKRYGVFESLSLKTKKIKNGVIFFECVNDDFTFKITLILDLNDERMFLEVEDAIIDSNDEKTLIKHKIDWNNFFRDLICNGQLEIFAQDDNQFLGRKDANIPLNIDLGRTVESFNAAITKLQGRLDKIA